ncbi:hypothetical protein [Jeotgalibacillus campisalis]|uniref:Uncharacterized protein n=1 Tax=Jeotgalibacillus campisalis TaxID=220754 RepID=A0A0C2QYR0_9BACL|nr:hypothetical protein [Jeotgalibacillus campisalis]KIL43175.1 hypothetical protein KR50_35780 [Jeotgalibacillus campisalis]
MAESMTTFEQLKKEFEENLNRSLEQKEIDFLHWLASKRSDQQAKMVDAFTLFQKMTTVSFV